jgi:CRP/FNR family transcriptional regulator
MKRFEGFPIFHGLSPEEVDRVLVASEELTFPAGHRIFKPGDPCDGFFVISAGSVDIRRLVPDGTGDVRVALLAKPSVFGEMSLIADRPRSAVAVAVEPVRLTKVSKAGFEGLLERGDLAAYKVIRAFARIVTERLKVTEEQFLSTLKEMGAEKSEKKLAELQAFRQKLFSEWSF